MLAASPLGSGRHLTELRISAEFQHEPGGIRLRALGLALRAIARSKFIPELDLDHLLGFVDLVDQSGAVRRYRASLRA
jgi:hypothetical protein